MSAPLTRGSTLLRGRDRGREKVCPAHAGIYLSRRWGPCSPRGLPRSRGDLPVRRRHPALDPESAPLTRGSTHPYLHCVPRRDVCPAHAGIYPSRSVRKSSLTSLPHSRGDLPQPETFEQIEQPSAPLTRGSTFRVRDACTCGPVCPAHAGIYLSPLLSDRLPLCLPRSRGDLPISAAAQAAEQGSAPLTRGSTATVHSSMARARVCPAHAGIYPL